MPDASDPTRISLSLTGPAVETLKARVDAGAPLEEYLHFALRASSEQRSPPPPLIARAEWKPGEVLLTPQAPLTRGLTYVGVWDGARLASDLTRMSQEYRVPIGTSGVAPRVEAVWPAQEVVPSNAFRFYVYFSRPMSQGELFRHVRLLDENGKPMAQAFQEVELWSADHRRVTLWINPGRTKQALGITETLGPVLMPERRYTLEIDSALRDQQGQALAQAFRHSFRTGPPDRTQPRIADWAIMRPASGGRSQLEIVFPEPLDRPMAESLIAVERVSGGQVEGEADVSLDGKRWSFAPKGPWMTGEYELVAGGDLCDLAGNSLYRLFETTTGHGPLPAAEAPVFRKRFSVR